MWKSLFDWFVQFFSGVSWGQFLKQHSQNAEGAAKLRGIFRNDIYPSVGMIMVVVTLVAVVIYYYVFNRKNGAGYGFKIRFWWTFLTVTALLVFAASLGVGFFNTKSFAAFRPFKFSLALSVAATLYSSVLFFLFSLIIKQRSVANRTPF